MKEQLFFHVSRTSCGSVVDKMLGFNPVNLGSGVAVTPVSHWWHQERNLAWISPMYHVAV